MTTTFKRLRNIAVGTALVLSSAGAFAASAPFMIDPTAYTTTPNAGVFTANQMTGNSTVYLTNTGGFNYSGTGYIQYATVSNNGSAVSVGTSGLGLDYGLYATFTQTFSCSGLLAVGTSCSVTGIALELFLDRGNNDTFTPASLSSGAPVIGGTTTGDVLLGRVNTVIAGSAGLDPLGNAFQTVNTNFTLTADGSKFFISPTPFYGLAFSQFGNSSGGATCSPDCSGATFVAINDESGSTVFNAVPEPMPLALMGLGMLGMVAFRRNQTKK